MYVLFQAGRLWLDTGPGGEFLSEAQVLCILGIVVWNRKAGSAPDCGSGRQPGCHGSSWAGATEPFHPQLCWL